MSANPNQMTKERFKEVRAGLGLSAANMAKVMRIAERTVFAYESGRSMVPGCTAAYLDTLIAVPQARRYAFEQAGVSSPRRIHSTHNHVGH